MFNVTLVLVPGTGASVVSVQGGTTLAQFAADHGLNGRSLIVDGSGVAPEDWSRTTLDGATEVFATGAVKGN